MIGHLCVLLGTLLGFLGVFTLGAYIRKDQEAWRVYMRAFPFLIGMIAFLAFVVIKFLRDGHLN